MIKYLVIAFVTVIAVLGLTGCQSINRWVSNNQTALQYAVQASVVDLIDNGKVTAASVIEAANDVEAFMKGNPTAKAADLVTVAREHINYDKLTAAQTLLINAILISLQADIERRIGDGIISADDEARVSVMIGWVRDAAVMTQGK